MFDMSAMVRILRPYNRSAWSDRAEGVIVLSGNMWHGPNVDGALYFLHKIFPLIVRKSPAAVLWLVGANPDRRIVKAAQRFSNRVVITGEVPDVSKYVARARVGICPIRVGVGVQTKILEALSVGTPVVCTSDGNSGVGGISGHHLWVADEPSQFADRVVQSPGRRGLAGNVVRTDGILLEGL